LSGTAPARELTVEILDDADEVAARDERLDVGIAAGIAMTGVSERVRSQELGTRLLEEFEAEAKSRGCARVFVTSFTFQAPGFYERHGYRETFRWEGVSTDDAAGVHFRKDL
jgi:ribosomal protein S18 acetylase RimI-like enzyme